MDSIEIPQIKQTFIDGLSSISQFWGLPKGMGAIFAVLYLSPIPLSLDELVNQTGLTKGAISTNVRGLSRMGLIHPVNRLADRKDYYEAETDFYKAIRSILKERQNSEFDRAVSSVKTTQEMLSALPDDNHEKLFLTERINSINSFFNMLDILANTISRLDNLGINTIQAILKILK